MKKLREYADALGRRARRTSRAVFIKVERTGASANEEAILLVWNSLEMKSERSHGVMKRKNPRRDLVAGAGRFVPRDGFSVRRRELDPRTADIPVFLFAFLL